MNKTLVMNFLGEVRDECSVGTVLEKDNPPQTVPIIHPDIAKLYLEHNSDHIIDDDERRLKTAIFTESLEPNNSLDEKFDQAVLAIDTMGGIEAPISQSLNWIRSRFLKEFGLIHAVIGRRAFSAGALAASYADQIHCMRDSQLVIHQPKNREGYKNRKLKFSDTESGNVHMSYAEAFELIQDIRQGTYWCQLTNMLKTDDGEVPPSIQERLISTIFTNRSTLQAYLEASTQLDELDYNELMNLPKVTGDGDFEIRGRELKQLGIVKFRVYNALKDILEPLQRLCPQLNPHKFDKKMPLNLLLAGIGLRQKPLIANVEIGFDTDSEFLFYPRNNFKIDEEELQSMLINWFKR